MINKTLLKQLFKANLIIIGIFTVILAFYQIILIFMYTPSMIDQIRDMAKSMGTVGNMYNMNRMTGGFTGYMAQFYFAMIIPMFILVYVIIVGNKIVAGRVDKGSMASILAAPVKRSTISVTTAVFFILSIVAILAANTIIGGVCCLAHKPADISASDYLLMSLDVLVFLISLSSITFFFSCVFNDSKNSIALGGGIPIVFFLLYIMSDFGEKLKVFKKMTIFSFNRPVDIADGKTAPVLICGGAAIILAVILYTAGIHIFRKKDLPV